MRPRIRKFINDQLSVWPEAAAKYRALKNVETRDVSVNGFTVCLQHNPDRIKSAVAEVDDESVGKRPCFLCDANRPKEQRHIVFEGRKGRKYFITVNPYPIFPYHLVISGDRHISQAIWHRYVDMLDMAKELDGFTIFYNGPKSGASAPDHMHFQACPRKKMNLEVAIDSLLDRISGTVVPDGMADDIVYISSVQDAHLYHYRHFTAGIFALRAKTGKSMAKLFYRLLDSVPIPDGEHEPRFNLLAYFANGEYRAIAIMRGSHRSHHYFSDGDDHLTISPGCADMAGLLIVPEKEDYEKIDSTILSELYKEVSVSAESESEIIWRLKRTQPKIEVGIMSANEIAFEIISDGAGPQKVAYQEGKINYNGTLYDELFFEARTMSTVFAEPTFVLHDVTIGVDFHWERKVTQSFAGTLKFIVEDNKVTAVNIVGVEDYLLSVISSEMKSSAKLEFLKAHAVISRSWVMSQIGNRSKTKSGQGKNAIADLCKPAKIKDIASLVTLLDSNLGSGKAVCAAGSETHEYVKWFDHDDHKFFDVCADDHCQRYQGLTMAVGETVRKAIDQTWGQVLMSGGKICDARFSKCCGGIMEKFSSCWADIDYPYLVGKADSKPGIRIPDLTVEDEARKWILSSPEAFCNTEDTAVLGQVLNDYDLETKDFYRWKVRYGCDEISNLIERKSGHDIGRLLALIPVERGVSGRLVKMRIVGSEDAITVGKELIIRRYLSESHLKSSAFVVDYFDSEGVHIPVGAVEAASTTGDPIPFDHLEITGAGWGHGVGLCQIGAAVMAYDGYDYVRILQHYYPGSEIVRG